MSDPRVSGQAGGRSILVIDGDAALRQSLAEQFHFQDDLSDARTIEAGDSATALRLFEQSEDEGCLLIAVVLALRLPDGDGRQLCQTLREMGLRCPVLLLTEGEEIDGAALADIGANDLMPKPVRIGVLLARLKAQIARFDRAEREDTRIGPYRFHPLARQLVAEQGPEGRRRIRLTEKEVAILDHLHSAEGEVVGREELLDEVWGYNEGVTTHTLETHIYRLRQKIEDDPSEARLLVTEPGGYRLVP